MNKLSVELKILDSRIQTNLPKHATHGSAAMDLLACVNEPTKIIAGETKLIGSGIAIYIGSPQYAALILPRSGLGHKHGIVLGNLCGLIDSDYQGEVKVSLWNRSTVEYVVQPLERIAQMLFVPVLQVDWKIVSEFNQSPRGEGGFGSTGKN